VKRLGHALETAGVALAVLFFCLLPRRAAHWAGRRLGGLAFWLSRRSRRTAVENLRMMLGVDVSEARRLARDSMRSAGAALSDMLRAPRMTRLLVRRDLEIPEETWRAIDDIRRGKRGAVFACAHFGNWEFCNLSGPFGALPPQAVVVRPLPNPWLDRLIFRLRSFTGQRLLLRAGAAMECMQWVRDGNICAITFDLPVPPDAGAEPVPFFGRATYTTVSVGYVAAMTRAPVYLCYVEPLPRARYRLVLDGPLEAPIGDTLRSTAVETTRRVSAMLETRIRGKPGIWGWWLKRWKVRPDGADRSLYPSYSVEATWFWPRGKEKRRDHR
jgi:KDO2-lipid IV(A) lauroyltransferase